MTRNTKLWLAAFTSVVFATGALAGVLIDRRWPRDLSDMPAEASRPLAGGGGRGGARGGPEVAEINLNRLDRVLGLSDEQRPAVREILRRRQARIRELQDQSREQFLTEQRALQADLAAVLTPDQRTRLESLRGRLLGPVMGRGPLGRGGPIGPGRNRGRE